MEHLYKNPPATLWQPVNIFRLKHEGLLIISEKKKKTQAVLSMTWQLIIQQPKLL